MAVLVKWLTHQIVALACVGSTPTYRPIYVLNLFLRFFISLKIIIGGLIFLITEVLKSINDNFIKIMDHFLQFIPIQVLSSQYIASVLNIHVKLNESHTIY